jgi:Uma2 family endonuclease
MVSQLKRTYTSEEYLALEVEAETRSEYRNGEIVLITGGTPEHNDISANLVAYLSCVER